MKIFLSLVLFSIIKANAFDIKKGKLINLIAKKGSISITMKAKAFESGKIGSYIKVKPNNAKSMISAKLINQNTAIYEEN